MKALITQRESVDRHGVATDTLESSYIRYFEDLGYGCFPVSNHISDVEYLFGIEPDLLVLTGGGSVSGKYYDPVREGEDMPRRDCVEKMLFEKAIRKDIPVLAICRGMQYVNALMGGRISVLSALQVHRSIGEDHPVYFGEDIIWVNNYHNDGIYTCQLADGLIPIVMDRENDVVEAYSSKKYKILGVQFHPERMISDSGSARKIVSLIYNFIR